MVVVVVVSSLFEDNCSLEFLLDDSLYTNAITLLYVVEYYK